MATIALRMVGSAIGSFFGPIGSAVGSAIGSTIGMAIDQSVINSTRSVQGARMTSAQIMRADEGHPIPRAYGYTRLSGSVIWATRLLETATTSRSGGKGGPKVTEYSYVGNVAIAICEGPVAMIKRIWADGKEIDQRDIEMRAYLGDEAQQPDPLIEAKQGPNNTPAYRGTAYVVFDNLALERFGNRIPQFEFEVIRPVGRLEKQITAVCLIPGATEFGLQDVAVSGIFGNQTIELNRHISFGPSDMEASIDELLAVCPNLKRVSLIVPWFGDDLRADQCAIKPGVVSRTGSEQSLFWSVNGATRIGESARLISQTDGRSNYGGTPSDASVIAAIRHLTARGLGVTLNPFVMMDIAPDNQLPDPWSSGNQPAFPWRGRITVNPAPGRPETIDQTQAAREAIDSFVGAIRPTDFAVSDKAAACNSATDFGYRRFILHCAFLAQIAGGVDGFLLGSEMRSLTMVRDHQDAFPFVEALVALADDVRSILPHTMIVYGADWSEYFGYQPADGSGDVYFNLDTLWSHPNIDAIGIDNYMPLADWRDEDAVRPQGSIDGALTANHYATLSNSLTAGEGYDWYYATQQDRIAQQRTSISDGAYNKPWIYRYKDMAGWWSNPHYERRQGVELLQPTAWVPGSKPIWFTEVGCPAVDKGANQPNVFVDTKSSENALPHFSNGTNDDAVQRQFLQVVHDGLLSDTKYNPQGAGGLERMIDADHVYVWAWDLRPFPTFPLNTEIWSDGENWLRGHWLNGRLGTVPDAELAALIATQHGLSVQAPKMLGQMLQGARFPGEQTGRAMIEAIAAISDLSLTDGWAADDAPLKIQENESASVNKIASQDLVMRAGAPFERTLRRQRNEMPSQVTLFHCDALQDYRVIATATARRDGVEENATSIDTAFHMDEATARTVGERALARLWANRETLSIALPLEHIALEPGDVIEISNRPDTYWRISRIEMSDLLEIEAHQTARISIASPQPSLPSAIANTITSGQFGGPPQVVFLDLPLWGTNEPSAQFRVAVSGNKAKTYSALVSSSPDNYQLRSTHRAIATMGTLVAPLPPDTVTGRLRPAQTITVSLDDGAFESLDLQSVLSGRNAVAVDAGDGLFEIIQFLQASEITPNVWQLDTLLRGQAGTDDAMRKGAPIGAQIVLLDRNVTNLGLADNERGLVLNWRIGESGKDVSDRYFTTDPVAGGERALRPLSPVHLTSQIDDAGQLHLSWIRRTRIDGDSWFGLDVPLGETEEAYSVRLSNSAGFEQSHQTSVPKFTLSAATRAALGPNVTVDIRQMSQSVGEGIPLIATLNLD